MPSNNIIIPELIIKSLLTKFIDWLRMDYNGKPDKKKSYLYKFFKESGISKYQYFEQISKLIIAKQNDPRYIELKIGYNPEEVNFPSVHISMPSEQEGDGYLGNGLEDEYDEDTDEYRNIYTKNYKTTYDIIIGSDNRSEANLLYHFFKAMIQAAGVSLATEGLKNLTIGGKDMSYDPRIPSGIYFRAVTLNFEYETSIPSWLSEKFIVAINSQLIIKNDE